MSDPNHSDRDRISMDDFVSLRRDVSDMKGLMAKMVDALGKIAVIDDRQQNSSVLTLKLIDRLERIEARQQSHDILDATRAGLTTRVETLETAVREDHLDMERNKARIETLKAAINTAFSALGVLGAGGAVALFKYFAGATGG